MAALKDAIRELSWAGFVARRRIKQKTLVVKRFFCVPSLPRNADDKVYIHLGCGDIASPEFINVDLCRAPHIHYVREASDLSIFPDNHADLVYACHLLEHMDPRDLRAVLWEWKRVLKVGGVLRLSVPDFDKLVEAYEICGRVVESIAGPLLGGGGAYRPHVSIFNFKYLQDMLANLGFTNIREWDPARAEHHDFEDWASRTIQWAGRRFHISLNIEATK